MVTGLVQRWYSSSWSSQRNHPDRLWGRQDKTRQDKTMTHCFRGGSDVQTCSCRRTEVGGWYYYQPEPSQASPLELHIGQLMQELQTALRPNSQIPLSAGNERDGQHTTKPTTKPTTRTLAHSHIRTFAPRKRPTRRGDTDEQTAHHFSPRDYDYLPSFITSGP
ncbi:hypothetical protein SODALDRAFT_102216 [Sodiomyces alkalinus F11]|uniref:Uncharacterized protein n=1 Tax=Sodiomyces alkalinus (strain CBS 110278 / VKM F-3762 / F11) TaxID=1314773 RepID=A0A3N2Q1Q7_SODAK|nr:hypothetical protein SODALDRAFT_102216 [Sodiomyces alkalinus F11]ROT40672.1 hypothetical protein SODALDRAFT_102216 [Sodiomyces alkalinus F11]